MRCTCLIGCFLALFAAASFGAEVLTPVGVAVLPLAIGSGQVSVKPDIASGSVHVVLDVSGYFQ